MNPCKTEQEYLDQIIEPVRRCCKRYGYLPSVLISQSCLENGYGIPSYWDNPQIQALINVDNMVGIKRELLNKSWVDVGKSVWQGGYIRKDTPEQYGSQIVTIKDDFRTYDCIERSFADYLCFMTWASNYGPGGEPKYGQKVLSIKDPETLIKTVSRLGYATGQTYPTSVMRIVQRHNLTQYDDLSGVEPTVYYPSTDKKDTPVNSPLAVYTKLSPNNSGKRTMPVDRITPHCVVGQMQIEDLLGWLAQPSAQASANYGIGTDGRIGLGVSEDCRAWTSSSSANDQRAVTIECASDKTSPYAFNSNVYEALVNLCIDICQRHGKTKLLWIGDKDKTLSYTPASNEMVLTVHRWFANKACPGDWMMARMGNLADRVTSALGGAPQPTPQPTPTPTPTGKIYRVQVGAYQKKGNADNRVAAVKSRTGYDCFIERGADGLYRVFCGSFSVKANADKRVNDLAAAGVPGAFIVEVDA